jgi:hypothetical protein
MTTTNESKVSLIVSGVALLYGIAIVGAFLVMAGLVWILRSYVQPLPGDAARGEERSKARVELQQAAQEQLENPAYIDPVKERVRLPIQQAMQMVIREARDPAAARSNLLARVSHFNPPPPPPAPEKPSEFE